jgi:hypothetical protein
MQYGNFLQVGKLETKQIRVSYNNARPSVSKNMLLWFMRKTVTAFILTTIEN